MDRDGIPFILATLVISAILFIVYLRSNSITHLTISYISFLFFLAFLFFFRDPDRRVPEGDSIIVAPTDGRIIDIQQDESGKSVSVFLSFLDVHVNRIPVAGTVTDIRKKGGSYFAAYSDKARTMNAAIETDIETPFGKVTIRQVVGFMARRLINRLKVGDEVFCGQRFGMIRFGSRIDLLLPSSAVVKVSMGKKIKGGSQVIGEFDNG
jgi:phosphatidylserine decarboxylase